MHGAASGGWNVSVAFFISFLCLFFLAKQLKQNHIMYPTSHFSPFNCCLSVVL